ncbi:MAG: hypothetical protein V6Z89_13915 [Desulfobacter sp.]
MKAEDKKVNCWVVEKANIVDFKINYKGVLKRTKRMIAFDKNIDVRSVSVNQTMKELMYSKNDMKDLKGLIDNVFFKDVDANASVKDLVKITTVGNLVSRIYSKYIPEENIR